jgi:uncharacterized coiled-coil protein SlyX
MSNIDDTISELKDVIAEKQDLLPKSTQNKLDEFVQLLEQENQRFKAEECNDNRPQ